MNDRIDSGRRCPAAPSEGACKRGNSLATAITGNAKGPVLIFRKRQRMADKSRRAEIPPASAEQATPAPEEEPTSSAELEISATKLRTSAKVPADDARHMITTFGIMGSLFIGIGGAVLTLRVSAALTGPALAELLVTLVTVVVIAVSSRNRPEQ